MTIQDLYVQSQLELAECKSQLATLNTEYTQLAQTLMGITRGTIDRKRLTIVEDGGQLRWNLAPEQPLPEAPVVECDGA